MGCISLFLVLESYIFIFGGPTAKPFLILYLLPREGHYHLAVGVLLAGRRHLMADFDVIYRCYLLIKLRQCHQCWRITGTFGDEIYLSYINPGQFA